MSKLNFEYVPLTFITNEEEIKKQIRNTLILIYLFEKYKEPVRLESLIEGTQYGYNASALESGKNKFLRISDIHESKVNWETVPYCNCSDEKTYLLQNDDILIARTGGTTGKSFKIDSPPLNSIYAGYLIRIRAKKTVNPDYIYLFLHSFAYWSQIVNLNEGNFRPKANAENLKALVLPNCSKVIQDEIIQISNGVNVDGYEDLYKKIELVLDEYDKNKKVEALLNNQLTQIQNLNQAILQEAVQGKLVPQDPIDEPASKLLERIKAEKAKLGKKEKPLSPIKTEEIPFEIPKSWVWCRLSDIADVGTGGTPLTSNPEYYNGIIPWITSSATNESFVNKAETFITEKAIKETNCQIYPIGTLIVAMYGQGKTRGQITELNISAATNQACAAINFNFNDLHLRKYIKLFFEENYLEIRKLAQGGAQPNLNLGKVKDTLIPLPPITVQKRIVEEVEKQLDKTKQLKEYILANQQATEQLLKALLHQAFEVEEKEVEV